MSMTRDEALTYLSMTFGELASEANWSQSQLLYAYGFAIDAALRQLGFTEGELATATVTQGDDITAYQALLDYFALQRYVYAFATRADVSVSGAINSTQSQIYAHTRALMGTAEERLAGLGLSPTDEMVAGRFTLDFLEPDIVVEGGIG